MCVSDYMSATVGPPRRTRAGRPRLQSGHALGGLVKRTRRG